MPTAFLERVDDLDDDGDDDRNSSADSDFFSPISASFFRPKQSQRQQNQQTEPSSSNNNRSAHLEGSGEKLPPLHDSSWIGARLSPIGSFDNEDIEDDDDDDRRLTSVYHRALHESLEAADFVGMSVPPPNERTRLLGSRPMATSGALLTGHPSSGGIGGSHQPTVRLLHQNRSTIHPLWDEPPSQSVMDDPWEAAFGNSARMLGRKLFTWGNGVCLASGIYLIVMGRYDYQNGSLLGDDDSWSLPCLQPSSDTLLQFGAFAPSLWMQDVSWWSLILRFGTSAFMCDSVVEYLVVIGAWRLVTMVRINTIPPPHPPLGGRQRSTQQPRTWNDHQPWYQWCGVYVASCLAGQLWMMAWDRTPNAVTGCVAWSTCGVLTHVGTNCIRRRSVLFLTAAVLLLLSIFQRPNSSVLGTVGASFFGWSLAVAEFTSWSPMDANLVPPTTKENHGPNSTSNWACWIGRILTLKIVILPTLFISFLF